MIGDQEKRFLRASGSRWLYLLGVLAGEFFLAYGLILLMPVGISVLGDKNSWKSFVFFIKPHESYSGTMIYTHRSICIILAGLYFMGIGLISTAIKRKEWRMRMRILAYLDGQNQPPNKSGEGTA